MWPVLSGLLAAAGGYAWMVYGMGMPTEMGVSFAVSAGVLVGTFVHMGLRRYWFRAASPWQMVFLLVLMLPVNLATSALPERSLRFPWSLFLVALWGSSGMVGLLSGFTGARQARRDQLLERVEQLIHMAHKIQAGIKQPAAAPEEDRADTPAETSARLLAHAARLLDAALEVGVLDPTKDQAEIAKLRKRMA